MNANGVAQNETDIQETAPDQKRKGITKRSIITFVVVSILNVALLALLWTQLLTPAHNQSSKGFEVSSGLGDASSPLLGKTAPDFTLATLDGSGKTIHLADLKGKSIMLNFWASWCTGCIEEAPFLQKTLLTLQSQGIVFVSIDGQEKASDALAFIKKYNLVSLDVQDTPDGSTAISYGVTGFPETVFINRTGMVVAKWIGPLNQQGLQLEMAKMTR
ncbi:MAG: TlpA family protein disulfide reductase [Ktedonobacteraceae bacterium]|nr:TlpA family protein disulfide reductase [Ktedonobacteraceae bacterium]